MTNKIINSVLKVKRVINRKKYNFLDLILMILWIRAHQKVLDKVKL